MNAYETIITPILSEKSTNLRTLRTYVFQVSLRANKHQILDAIKELYNVTPVTCRTIRMKGKPKRLRRESGYTSSWKKAYVTLEKGASISQLDGA